METSSYQNPREGRALTRFQAPSFPLSASLKSGSFLWTPCSGRRRHLAAWSPLVCYCWSTAILLPYRRFFSYVYHFIVADLASQPRFPRGSCQRASLCPGNSQTGSRKPRRLPEAPVVSFALGIAGDGVAIACCSYL